MRIQITFTLGLLLVFVDGREVDRAEARNPCGNALKFFLGGFFAGLGGQRAEHAVQIVAVFQQLILQGLAAHGQRLPFHALLFELTADQLRLLLSLVAALLGIAQFTVGVFQSDLRGLEFFVDSHAFVEQLFKLQAQLFQRRLALLQVEAQLLAFFGQAFGLHFQTLQRLTRRIVLRFERAQTYRQLMGVILVLPRFLTHPVKALAQAVALGQQQLTLLGIQRHAVESFLQLQARFADAFVFQSALFVQLGELFVETSAAQGQLFGLGFTGRQLGFQFTLLAGFVLQQTT
ncbi:hypothetical protein D3C71_1172670 [compost metagenome]